MPKVIHEEVMWAELKVNCYTGPQADQHQKYWNVYVAGDKQVDILPDLKAGDSR